MRIFWIAACALLLAPGATAGRLTVAEVSGQGVACVFTPACAVYPTDTYGVFKLFGDGGVGRLLTRTYSGAAGTPAAGMTGYSYHLDMTAMMALGTPSCVERLTMDVGPLASLHYVKGGDAAEVFVVTSGGEGTIGISSATLSGRKLTITFDKPVCPTIGNKPGRDSLYFGFASKNPPVPAKAQLEATLEGATVDIRVPKH